MTNVNYKSETNVNCYSYSYLLTTWHEQYCKQSKNVTSQGPLERALNKHKLLLVNVKKLAKAAARLLDGVALINFLSELREVR